MAKNTQYAFEVHPSVVFKLGEDLITDDYQALAELAKNSYDADATKVDIIIDTERCFRITDNEVIEVEAGTDDVLQGVIEVKDNGCGMSIEDIERGWLTISASRKRKMKERGEKTAEKRRTPLGDKGLGRLGAQRLGRVMELQTRKQGEQALRVMIDWTRFEGDDPLSSIPIAIFEVDIPAKKGTFLRIIGLKSLGAWEDECPIQNRFVDIISPYSDDLGFKASLFVNGAPIDLRKQSKLALSKSIITYALWFCEGKLHTNGAISARYLTNLNTRSNQTVWDELVGSDGGRAFFAWLTERNHGKADAYGLSYGGEKHFCSVDFSMDFNGIPSLERDESGKAFNPGDFEARIDFVERQAFKKEYAEASKAASLLNEIKGVKVYRDGFGVPVKEDIFPFAAQWTSGTSWYTLREDNVIGYLNLTADGNAALIETTNREEFKDNEYYRNLKRLLAAWLKRTAEVQEYLRRGFTDYRERTLELESRIAETQSPKSIAEAVNKRIDNVKKANTSNSLFVDPKLEAAMNDLEANKAAIDLLAHKADDAEARLEQAWELVGLGIIAESVAHEMANISGRLIDNAKTLAKYNDRTYRDEKINASAELTKSSANALAKQIAHLDTSLKYVRDKRDVFKVKSIVCQCVEYYRDRMNRNCIDVAVKDGKDFTVRMNQGRLLQVLDNLILNSEYWLNEARAAHEVAQPLITIEVEEPYLLFSDNGAGIDPSVEHSLFDPFVTRKGSKRHEGPKGRGLGLYIARQLLDEEDATIVLDKARNDRGRRYRFRVNLSQTVVPR